MEFNPGLNADDDGAIAALVASDDPVDITGATISVDVYVPQSFVTEGKAAIQMYLNDLGGGHYSSLTYTSVSGLTGDDFNTFSFTAEQISGVLVAGFDLTKAVEFGIQINSGGHPPEVTGTFFIDNFVLTPGSEVPQPTVIDFSTSTGWWANSSRPYSYEAAGVQWQPVASSNQIVYSFSEPAAVSGLEFSITFTLDQAFIDSGANLQPFVQSTAPNYSSAQWCGYISSPVVGENTATCTVESALSGTAFQAGIQVPGSDEVAAGVITITSASLTVPAAM